MSHDEGITRDEVIELLQWTAIFDRRKPNQVDVLAWLEVARLDRWTFEEAKAAITAHHREEPTVWLVPGLVSKRIKEARRDAAMREPVVLPDPVGQERLRELIKGAFRSLGVDGDEVDRRRGALLVQCPWCGSAVGEPCTQLGKAGRVQRRTPHPSRVEASEVASL